MDVRVGPKKAERQRIDAFELWCWRRLLRVPWTKRRSNQSILKEVSPEYSLEWISFKRIEWCWSWSSSSPATCCKELTHLKRSWCWERLKAGGEGDDRQWDGWMASLTRWTWVWASSRSWWSPSGPGEGNSYPLQYPGLENYMDYIVHGIAKSRTQLSDFYKCNE